MTASCCDRHLVRSRRRRICAYRVVALVTLLIGMGSTAVADFDVQLSFATQSITEFQQLATQFKSRIETLKADPEANLCADQQLRSLQGQLLGRYTEAREALTSALAVALPSASPDDYVGLLYSGAENHAEFQALRPGERASLTQALDAFRSLRYNNADHNLLGQGCDNDFLDLISDAEATDPRDRYSESSVKDILDDWMTPTEKREAEQTTESGEPIVKFRMEEQTWNDAGFWTEIKAFDNGFKGMARNSLDVADRLDQLVACCPEDICNDPTLAYAFSQSMQDYSGLASAYEASMRIALSPEDHDQIVEIATGWLPLPDMSAIPVEAQLEVTSMHRRLQKANALVKVLQNDLRVKGPCDPEDLLDLGRRVAEPGQDPEAGVDGGATPVGGDGGGGQPGFYYVKLGVPQIRSDGDVAQAGSCRLEISRTNPPSFPDEIRPGGHYRVYLNLHWRTDFFDLDLEEIVISVAFFDVSNSDTKRFTNGPITGGGTSSGSFDYFRYDPDNSGFDRESGAIVLSYGGSIDCRGGSASTGGTVITQAYRRVSD